MKKIGVLALQGAFAEHIALLHQFNVATFPIRLPGELDGLDGIIIPGGESTTISRLMREYDLVEPLRQRCRDGLPVMGTCAGMIVLARDVPQLDARPLGIMDIQVRRNAFGRQVDSFEAHLDIPTIGQPPFHGIFIRAPLIQGVGDSAEMLASLPDGSGVAARQGSMLALAFHPELTDDPRLHSYFLGIIDGVS